MQQCQMSERRPLLHHLSAVHRRAGEIGGASALSDEISHALMIELVSTVHAMAPADARVRLSRLLDELAEAARLEAQGR
jgi:hypothetical protein